MERKDLLEFLNQPLLEIITTANSIRKRFCGNEFHLCSIINARSGLCSGDCAYCAQSRVSSAKIDVYPMKSKEEIVEYAKEMKRLGASRFSIVTSGEAITDRELDVVMAAIPEIRELGLRVCASLGILDKGQLRTLKSAGLDRYHHNIETSPRFYPKIVSTHRFEDRIRTIEWAKEVGLSVCSGGILGMGEDWEDRVEMALLLRALEVDSVPVNFLIPIKGTKLGEKDLIDPITALKSVALFRYAMPNREVRVIAGREVIFGRMQVFLFLSGANGMMIGGYLTTKGDPIERDRELISQVKEEWLFN